MSFFLINSYRENKLFFIEFVLSIQIGFLYFIFLFVESIQISFSILFFDIVYKYILYNGIVTNLNCLFYLPIDNRAKKNFINFLPLFSFTNVPIFWTIFSNNHFFSLLLLINTFAIFYFKINCIKIIKFILFCFLYFVLIYYYLQNDGHFLIFLILFFSLLIINQKQVITYN